MPAIFFVVIIPYSIISVCYGILLATRQINNFAFFLSAFLIIDFFFVTLHRQLSVTIYVK